MYQDWAWDAFDAINATARVGQGFSKISDVNAPDGGSFDNLQESFLFAEVMKYSYLIHAPVSSSHSSVIRVADRSQDAPYQVSSNGQNKWVFNTEAHPLIVVGPPV